MIFFQELGPDNIFLFRTSGDPSQDNRIPKEAKRRPLKPEYADYIKRWCFSVEDVGLELLIPPVVDGKPITARVPGYESDTINVTGTSRQHGGDLAARFRLRPLLHPRGGSARRPRGDARRRAWPRRCSPTETRSTAPS